MEQNLGGENSTSIAKPPFLLTPHEATSRVSELVCDKCLAQLGAQ